MCRTYYPAFQPRRNPGAACGECRRANIKCKLPPRPKKPRESRAGWGKGRGLGGAALTSASSEMGGKKGRRGRRGSRGGTSTGRMVSV